MEVFPKSKTVSQRENTQRGLEGDVKVESSLFGGGVESQEKIVRGGLGGGGIGGLKGNG